MGQEHTGLHQDSLTSLAPCPQGNDITLVAYQPDLPPQTPQAFEIIFREVGGSGQPSSLMSPFPRVCPPLSPLFLQKYWQRPDGQPATREHLLMALADLDEILIRATYSTSTAVAAIADVAMDVAVPPQPGLPPAPEVEECRCPPGYHGLSCQVSPAPPSITPSPPSPPYPPPQYLIIPLITPQHPTISPG